MAAEERPLGFKKTTSGRLDEWQGPYTSLQQAQDTVPDFAKPGQTIQLITGASYEEYWWKDGIALSNLVLKNTGTGGTVADATTTTKGKVRLAGDLAGTADTPTVPGLAAKLDKSKLAAGTNVTITENLSTGVVTINAAAGTVEDATTLVKGKVRLAGHLGGTADSPTVPGLAAKMDRDKILGGSNVSVVRDENTGTVTISSSGGTGTINDATTTEKGKLRLAGDLAGTADVPTVPKLADKIDRSKIVAGQNVSLNYDTTSGNLTISSTDTVTPDSSTTVKGKVRLAGDLAGTADNPTVPALANKIDRTKIVAGENAAVSYDSGTGNLTVSGILHQVVTQSAHGFAVGTILKRSGSSYARAQADSVPNSHVTGIVTAVIDANTFVMNSLSGSFITLSGLTPGTIYYLSQTTAGAYTATQPSSGIQKILFQGITNTVAEWMNVPYVTGAGVVDSSVPDDDSSLALTDNEYANDINETPWSDNEYIAWLQGTGGGGGGGGGGTEIDTAFTNSEYTAALAGEENAWTNSEYTAAVGSEQEAFTNSQYIAS